MKLWSVQDAKARFSEFLETCLKDGPQLVTKRGEEAAVLVPMQEWRRMQLERKPNLKELLMAPAPIVDLQILPRSGWKRKQPKAFK